MTPAENLAGRLRGRWHGRYGDLRNRDIKTSCPVKRASALAAAIHEQRSMMAAFATAGGPS
jgi:hypothetical protein